MRGRKVGSYKRLTKQFQNSRIFIRLIIVCCAGFILWDLPSGIPWIQSGALDLGPDRSIQDISEAVDHIHATRYYLPQSDIPKIIHQTWITKNLKSSAVPLHVKRSVSNWRSKNTGFYYILWDDTDMENMVERFFPGLYDFYMGLPRPVMKSDLFRLLALKAFGGIVCF